jgi:Nif-specific regulatory protein
VTISLQFKKLHLDLTGKVVRAFSDCLDTDELIYGVEIDDEKKINKFLEVFVLSFTSDRLKECLIDAALKDRYTNASDGFEMFSLLLSLFKDITHFGDKEGFLENMLAEVVRVMNAQRSSVFLINPETNELEAVAALGLEKNDLKFDYRLGIAGSVFTTGVALNIDTVSDRTRFNNFFDKKFSFETKSIICHPIHNREDKIIGVIQVINKRNEYRFTVEDEKTMKVLTLMFSSVFHKYNPMSESSQIRRFSAPHDRKLALIGRTPHLGSLRSSIIKLKDLDVPTLIHGESGVGKNLYAKILHSEGQRGLKTHIEIDCNTKNMDKLARELWGNDEECQLSKSQGGSVTLREVSSLSMAFQEKLYDILVAGGTPGSIVSLDARIMATTSKDLGKLVDDGVFSRNLFELLSTTYIYLEPLRRRMDDFEMLLEYFLRSECKEQGLLIKSFAPKMVEKMKIYDWPSNVKELKTMVSRAVLYNPKSHVISDIELDVSASPLIDTSAKKRIFGDLPFVSDFAISLKDRVAIVEREMILNEIKRCNGNKSKAAKEMGISREALRKKMLLSRDVLDTLENQFPHERKKAA